MRQLQARIALLAAAAALAGGALAAPSALAAPNPVITDCNAHGGLSQHYTVAELRAALNAMSATVKEYTNCYDVINRALLAAISGQHLGGGGSGGSGGSLLPTPVIVILVALVLAAATFGAIAVRRRRGPPRSQPETRRP